MYVRPVCLKSLVIYQITIIITGNQSPTVPMPSAEQVRQLLNFSKYQMIKKQR